MTLLKDKSKRDKLRHELYEKLETTGEELAPVIKSLRSMLMKDQKEFSKYIGISLSALRRIEQSNGNITIKTINKILMKFSLKLIVKVR